MATREELNKALNEALWAWRDVRSRLDDCEIEVDVSRTIKDGNALREERHKENVLKRELEKASKNLDRATAELAYTSQTSTAGRFREPKEDVPHDSGIARFMKWCCYRS